MTRVPVVIMGVSGAGKTSVGSAIAEMQGRPFIDADDLHPEANRRKMEGGMPLDDDDRIPWIANVGRTIAELTSRGSAPVVACSALKRSYRDALRVIEPRLGFVHLEGSRELLEARITARRHAYMPPALLSSQLTTLQAPVGEERVLTLDISASVAELAGAASDWLERLEAAEPRPKEHTR